MQVNQQKITIREINFNRTWLHVHRLYALVDFMFNRDAAVG